VRDATPERIRDAVLDEMRLHAKVAAPADDVTLVAIQITG
jgi:hypothetical protein